MPELPEVETIVNELRHKISGLQIKQCEVYRDNIIAGDQQQFVSTVTGKRIETISRRGKYLIFQLSSPWRMIVHLRMTGKFICDNQLLPQRHNRLCFLLSDDSYLIYSDMRCFGTFELCSEEEHPKLNSLGPEPLSKEFTPRLLRQTLQKRKTNIKDFLLDQRNLAGLGNIYASEILFDARIHPETPTQLLQKEDVSRLYTSIGRILKKAIRHNGTTISDYRQVDDKTGAFQHFLKVYGKENQPCRSCGQNIQKIKQNQRSSFFCPACQIKPEAA